MTKRAEAKMKAHQKSVTELDENRGVYEDFEVLDESITEYVAGHEILMKYAQKDEENTVPETNDKGKAFEAVKKTGTRLAQKALSWAEKNDTTLTTVFDLEISDFTGFGAFRSIGVARNLEEKLRLNLVALASERVTKLMVDDFKLEIDALEKSSPKPQLKRNHGSENSKNLTNQLKKQDALLATIKRRIVNEYSETEPTIVNTFLASCRIDDPSTRKTLLRITIKDKSTGGFLAGVYCDVLEMMNEEQFTDALGEAEITGMKPATMNICFSKEGYEDVTKPFTIKRGEKVKLEVEMVKIA